MTQDPLPMANESIISHFSLLSNFNYQNNFPQQELMPDRVKRVLFIRCLFYNFQK